MYIYSAPICVDTVLVSVQRPCASSGLVVGRQQLSHLRCNRKTHSSAAAAFSSASLAASAVGSPSGALWLCYSVRRPMSVSTLSVRSASRARLTPSRSAAASPRHKCTNTFIRCDTSKPPPFPLPADSSSSPHLPALRFSLPVGFSSGRFLSQVLLQQKLDAERKKSRETETELKARAGSAYSPPIHL